MRLPPVTVVLLCTSLGLYVVSLLTPAFEYFGDLPGYLALWVVFAAPVHAAYEGLTSTPVPWSIGDVWPYMVPYVLGAGANLILWSVWLFGWKLRHAPRTLAALSAGALASAVAVPMGDYGLMLIGYWLWVGAMFLTALACLALWSAALPPP